MNETKLFLKSDTIHSGEKINPGFEPEYSMVVRFSDAKLKKFEKPDLEHDNIEEAWFFNTDECLHIRRYDKNNWLALRISEKQFDGIEAVESGVFRNEITHLLAGEHKGLDDNLFYEEMLPFPRKYPVEADKRAGLRCTHYTFEADEGKGMKIPRSIYRPVDVVDFKEEVESNE